MQLMTSQTDVQQLKHLDLVSLSTRRRKSTCWSSWLRACWPKATPTAPSSAAASPRWTSGTGTSPSGWGSIATCWRRRWEAARRWDAPAALSMLLYVRNHDFYGKMTTTKHWRLFLTKFWCCEIGDFWDLMSKTLWFNNKNTKVTSFLLKSHDFKTKTCNFYDQEKLYKTSNDTK